MKIGLLWCFHFTLCFRLIQSTSVGERGNIVKVEFQLNQSLLMSERSKSASDIINMHTTTDEINDIQYCKSKHIFSISLAILLTMFHFHCLISRLSSKSISKLINKSTLALLNPKSWLISLLTKISMMWNRKDSFLFIKLSYYQD